MSGNNVNFVLDCIPSTTTHQSGQCIMKGSYGKRYIGRKPSSDTSRAASMLMYELLRHKLPVPFDGAIQVSMLWVYPWTSRHTKKQKSLGSIPKATIPDADNSCKMILDIMTRLKFWNDDGQVSDLLFRKRYGDRPRIEIEITKALRAPTSP